MNYQSSYEKGRMILKEAGVEDCVLDARLLLEAVCHSSFADLYSHPDRELTDSEETEYMALISRRAKRIPLAYILEEQEFMGLSFYVNENVLVPNQDTETLVEEALREISDGMTFMDLCTGSGCIGLSILNYTNDCKCVATDISDKAIEVARRNSDKLGLNDRFSIVKTDLFPQGEPVKYDMIISNPPYIPSGVIDGLAPEVKAGEPMLALDGGEDGLIFYRRIAEHAHEWLCRNGWLMMEIGYDQGESVPALLKEKGFNDIEVIKDLGGCDRVVRACLY
ncbi:peptide chain release factor N(5)-glutamine methyltransferase [Butyrivibrio sp. MC2013]|uniref:peptide chain release factor N(5)-glutamine methyltransferase n=1 Tax=Butyrivibrio sp. MC2013 TaxID=1280686 RepID=UPI00041D5E50|nr:peptide chain release factor N(5)-glutamine methyltransferase [Butyrivibrio sp. MC2013]